MNKKAETYRKRMKEHTESCFIRGKSPGYEDIILEVLIDIHEMLSEKLKMARKEIIEDEN